MSGAVRKLLQLIHLLTCQCHKTMALALYIGGGFPGATVERVLESKLPVVPGTGGVPWRTVRTSADRPPGPARAVTLRLLRPGQTPRRFHEWSPPGHPASPSQTHHGLTAGPPRLSLTDTPRADRRALPPLPHRHTAARCAGRAAGGAGRGKGRGEERASQWLAAGTL